MNTIELKNKLHSLIDSIGDNERLQAMLTFVNSSTSADWWDTLSDNNKKDIEEGLSDLKNRNIHSDEEVRSSIRKRIFEARLMEIVWSNKENVTSYNLEDIN